MEEKQTDVFAAVRADLVRVVRSSREIEEALLELEAPMPEDTPAQRREKIKTLENVLKPLEAYHGEVLRVLRASREWLQCELEETPGPLAPLGFPKRRPRRRR